MKWAVLVTRQLRSASTTAAAFVSAECTSARSADLASPPRTNETEREGRSTTMAKTRRAALTRVYRYLLQGDAHTLTFDKWVLRHRGVHIWAVRDPRQCGCNGCCAPWRGDSRRSHRKFVAASTGRTTPARNCTVRSTGNISCAAPHPRARGRDRLRTGATIWARPRRKARCPQTHPSVSTRGRPDRGLCTAASGANSPAA